MALSYDPRRWARGPKIQPGDGSALRGPKRTGPIGAVVPGDDLEVARELARLRECCQESQIFARRAQALVGAGEDVFDIDDYGRGGCYYESMVIHGFSDPLKARFFPMNEPSGSLKDESGKLVALRNGNPVQALTPAPFPAEPEVGFQELDGTGDYFATAAETFLNFNGNEKFTIMVWARPGVAFGQGTIASRVSGANGWFLRVNSSNKVEFSRRGGSVQITSKTALRDDVWSHIAVTYDGVRLTMYVDGVWDKQVADNSSATGVASAALQIGAKGGADTWKGGLLHLAMKKGIAFSKKTIEERLTFCSESEDDAPPPGGLIDSYTDIPADTCIAGQIIGAQHTDYANIKSIIAHGWVPHVSVFIPAPTENVCVSVHLLLRKGDGTTESLGNTATIATKGYPSEWAGNMALGSPSEEGTGEFHLAFGSGNGFSSTADSGQVSVFITWHKADDAGLTPEVEPGTVIPDGTADTVPIWDTATGRWLPGKIRNANVDAAAAIAYSKLALANSIVNADIAAAAAIAVSKLSSGSAGQVVKMVGGVPTWAAEDSGVTDHGALTGLADDDHTQYRLESVALVNADIDAAAAIAQSKIAFTAWQAFTPTLTATVTNPTMGAGAVVSGSYMQIGKLVVGRLVLVFGGAGMAAGSGTYRIAMPVAAPAGGPKCGAGDMLDNSGNDVYLGGLEVATTTTFQMRHETLATAGLNLVTEAAPVAWAPNDQFSFFFVYEAA